MTWTEHRVFLLLRPLRPSIPPSVPQMNPITPAPQSSGTKGKTETGIGVLLPVDKVGTQGERSNESVVQRSRESGDV